MLAAICTSRWPRSGLGFLGSSLYHSPTWSNGSSETAKLPPSADGSAQLSPLGGGRPRTHTNIYAHRNSSSIRLSRLYSIGRRHTHTHSPSAGIFVFRGEREFRSCACVSRVRPKPNDVVSTLSTSSLAVGYNRSDCNRERACGCV
jgi:hypothetical protein